MARAIEGTDAVELGGREPKTEDKPGRVRVYLQLVDEKNKNITSNITAVVYLKGVKVTDAQKRIVAAFTKAK